MKYESSVQRISIDPALCGGKPCIKGTRFWVSLVLDFLADGMSEAELLADTRNLRMGTYWRRSPTEPKRRESASSR